MPNAIVKRQVIRTYYVIPYHSIPNRTFLVRFGSISDEFGRAMVRSLARRSRAKIPMGRPNEPDVLPKRTKKEAIKHLPYPNSS